MPIYYQEHDLFLADWLRNLIRADLLPEGAIDTRAPADIVPGDLDGYTQLHFNAGVGHWAVAFARAVFTDGAWTFADREEGGLQRDDFRRLHRAARPVLCLGNAPAGPAGSLRLGGIRSDLEGADYAFRAISLLAAGVDAAHDQRVGAWVAQPVGADRGVYPRLLAVADRSRFPQGDARSEPGPQGSRGVVACPDGRARLAEPRLRGRPAGPAAQLADADAGLTARKALSDYRVLRALGEVPDLGLLTEVIAAWMDVHQ